MTPASELLAAADRLEALAGEAAGYFTDYRWTCGKGHFIAAASVVSEDYRDDSAYYGVGTRTSGECKRCGLVDEPRYVPMRFVAINEGAGT